MNIPEPYRVRSPYHRAAACTLDSLCLSLAAVKIILRTEGIKGLVSGCFHFPSPSPIQHAERWYKGRVTETKCPLSCSTRASGRTSSSVHPVWARRSRCTSSAADPEPSLCARNCVLTPFLFAPATDTKRPRICSTSISRTRWMSMTRFSRRSELQTTSISLGLFYFMFVYRRTGPVGNYPRICMPILCVIVNLRGEPLT